MLLKFAIKDFKDDREFKNLSLRTIESYLSVLKEFHEFCTEREIVNVEDVTISLVKSYLLFCQKERKNNPTTVNSKLHVLKIFFNYIEEIEIIGQKNNPTRKLSFAKEDVKIEVFTDDQIKQMLKYYQRLKYRDKSFYAYRDYAIIVFLLGSGVRIGELINLRWSDVDMYNMVITVFGKKRQQSSVPMALKLNKELAEYRNFVDQHFGYIPEFLFTDLRGQQMTTNAIKNIFKRLKRTMNFKNVRLSGHTFRHTFAHRALMAGMDVFSLQKMLRHSKIDMTMRYVAIWGTALKDQNEKFNPLNSIDI